MSDSQKEQYEKWVKECHAQGRCEFSGLGVVDCVQSICDCFETMQGALAIEISAGVRKLNE